jgi:hypothetical protein
LRFVSYILVSLRKLIYSLAFFIVLIFSSTNIHAQIIKGEAILGLNLTQVDGDEVYGFKKFGANVGAGVLIPFTKNGKWEISLEALFSQKGSYQKPQFSDSLITGEYNLRLNYAEVPLMVLFTDKEIVSFGAGFAWGRLVGVEEWEHGQKVDSTTLDSGTYSDNDFSILGDLRFRLWQGLKLNLRYQYSLVKIRTREFEDLAGNTWTRDQYNNVITLRLIWVFNDKKAREYYRNAQVE